ncbi:unnamed protein product [Effrenium voratum]|nr:unnamed protein product [Effrenium voratum]
MNQPLIASAGVPFEQGKWSTWTRLGLAILTASLCAMSIARTSAILAQPMELKSFSSHWHLSKLPQDPPSRLMFVLGMWSQPHAIDLPTKPGKVVPQSSSWDTMQGFELAKAGPFGFSLLPKAGPGGGCFANMSVTWYAKGHYKGQGDFINDAKLILDSKSSSFLTSLTLKAQFGSGYIEEAGDGPVAVLPLQVYATCRGLQQSPRIFLRGALFGNGTANLVGDGDARRRDDVMDKLGRFLLAPVHARPPFPGDAQNPTVEDLEKLLASPQAGVTTLLESSITPHPAQSERPRQRGRQRAWSASVELLSLRLSVNDFVQIINIGQKVWDLLVPHYQFTGPTFATGLPSGVKTRDDWDQLDGWYVHKLSFKHTWGGDGGSLLTHYTQISYDCKGRYHGRGAYIDNFEAGMFHPSAPHYGTITGMVSIGNPINAGTEQHPVAMLPLTQHVRASGAWFYDDIIVEIPFYVYATCRMVVPEANCHVHFNTPVSKRCEHKEF